MTLVLKLVPTSAQASRRRCSLFVDSTDDDDLALRESGWAAGGSCRELGRGNGAGLGVRVWLGAAGGGWCQCSVTTAYPVAAAQAGPFHGCGYGLRAVGCGLWAAGCGLRAVAAVTCV